MTGSERRPRRQAPARAERRTPPLGSGCAGERERLGLSLRELARRLEVSPSLVSQIETGKTQPSVRTLYAIVSELGVSLDEMFAAGEPGGPAAGLGPCTQHDPQSTPEPRSGAVASSAPRAGA